MKTVQAMVVEDSPLARELIANTLNSDPRIRVVCAVESAEKALRLVPGLAPDVISMDIRLPGMDGIQATRRIMQEFPTPIVVVAADLAGETISNSMRALGAGALTVVEKPRVDSPEAYRALARRLCDQMVSMSRVKVVRQRFNGTTHRGAGVAALPARPTARPARPVSAIGIVASTGGPPAIASILKGLRPDLPAPLLVVQHMGAQFLEGFAGWLGSVCGLEVVLAKDRQPARPGQVHVAPGGWHMTYRGGHIRLVAPIVAAGHVPSGDALFESLAAEVGPSGLGLLLTGMGEDGARGLLAMRRAGALTIAQDRPSSAVYGMPAAAMALGAAVEELPACAMAERVCQLVAAEASAP